MNPSFIRVDRDGAVATVTLARVERRNAINVDMMRDLIDASNTFTADEQARAVIFRAEGSDFSVGADLSQVAPEGPPPSLLMERWTVELGATLLRAVRDIPQPTICAIQGVATGAGGCLASACDFRIGADTARIGYGEVKLGINLMWRAVPICVHLVGPARAKRMIMSGKLFDAATLERWGFLDEVTPAGELDAAARAMADEFAALPPISVQMIKRSIDAISGALDQAIMHMDSDQWLLATRSEDYKEAIQAFFEKRPPSFTGR